MEKVLDYVKWLISLPEKHKPFALSLLAIAGLIFVAKLQTDKLDLALGEIRVLNQEKQALQQQKEQQAITFKEEKYIAVMQVQEACELRVQNIYKKHSEDASKINKPFTKKR